MKTLLTKLVIVLTAASALHVKDCCSQPDRLHVWPGHDVYIDVSGWHLFLREVKAAKGLNLAQALAQQFGQDISSQKYNKGSLEEVLKKVPIKLGGGKAQLPLSELLPAACVQDLERILADFEKDN